MLTDRIGRCLAVCLVAAALLASAPHAQRGAASGGAPIVILVSIDGWRWDYLERYRPPAIAGLATRGVHAEGLIPVFPSKTFPNHYTIVTGLRPARHGILSNNIVDPWLPGRFSLGDEARQVQQDTRWWGGEPIWVTAERQGLIAATLFWPGSDVEIAGDRPTYYWNYSHDTPNGTRIDQLLRWLALPEARRPALLTTYFSDVDDAGHDLGPESPETGSAVRAIDRSIAQLMAGVERLGLGPRTHLVLVSDHGMAPLSRDRTIVLDDYLDMSTVDLIDSAPIVGLNPRAGTTTEQLLAALDGKHPALQIYTRDTLPDHLRLRGHPRLPAVIGIADDAWHTTTRRSLERENGNVPAGNHGYDPMHRSMHGLFLAVGSRFKRGAVVPAFENVHVYELLCHLLGITPASNDGALAATAALLETRPPSR